MSNHPVDLVYQDGVPVEKTAVRGYEKTRKRLWVADANEIRNTDLAAQSAGLYVRALQRDFDLATDDMSTPDDGVNCVISRDGVRFKPVPVDTSRAQRIVTASGPVTALADDDILVINKTANEATVVNVDWSTRTRALTVVDGKGNANAYNITIVPASGQTQYGIADLVATIDGNGGSVTLTPLSDGTGAF